MSSKTTLATKYRPKHFNEIVEQETIKATLQNQVNKGTIKNCYLFHGPAGCGKTTSARIFANDINDGVGTITELDAASNSGVENVRSLIADARFKPIGQKYKTYIIDECHALSDKAWQAFLLALEEPVPTSVFLFCTTDPQKIPKTIISRVQRFGFKKITQSKIVERLKYIIESENSEGKNYTYTEEALVYIAKLAEGGMRDSITLMEKALDFDTNLTLESAVEALGTVSYSTMFDLTDALCDMDKKSVIRIIEDVFNDGSDLKQFMQNYCDFVLDLCKYDLFRDFDTLQIPLLYKDRMSVYTDTDYQFFQTLLNESINIKNLIKWEPSPKPIIESNLLLLCTEA